MLVACMRGLMKECSQCRRGGPRSSSRCKKSMVETKASSNQNASINKKKIDQWGRTSSLPLTKYSWINHSKRGFTHFTQLNPAHRGRVPILLQLQSPRSGGNCRKNLSHPCSFLSITAGYFTLEFKAFMRLTSGQDLLPVPKSKDA
jgi:hypothetical protein